MVGSVEETLPKLIDFIGEPTQNPLINITPQEFRSRKVALITGITGQDGSYLAELLLEKGYKVHGIIRRSASINTARISHLMVHLPNGNPMIQLHYGDLTDGPGLINLMQQLMPSEVYNLAAQSHVQVSFTTPEYTGSVDGLGCLRMLEAIRSSGLTNHTRYYQASTSEMFGHVQQIPQSELTPFYPRSPYGVAKVYAHWMVVNYRESYDMFACSGILFNHESPRRGHEFVTRKITRAVAAILRGKQDYLVLGNLEAKRDWGHAKDYVRGMHAMLQHNEPKDYVLATGRTTSVKTFVELSFQAIGINLRWEGKNEDTIGYDTQTGNTLVKVDRKYYRPAEVDLLLGDPTKAAKELGWKPTIELEELVNEMVQADLHAIDNGTHLLY